MRIFISTPNLGVKRILKIYFYINENFYIKYNIKMSDWFQIGDTFGSEKTTTALSSDGSIMVVGTPENGDNNEGQVNVYQKSVITGEYEQLGSSINGDVSGAKFGASVAINPDGDIIAVGASGAEATSNYIRVYQYSGGSWSQLGSDITGTSQLGFSVSISSDGTVLAIGQPGYESSKGRTLVYRYSSGSWSLEETVTGSTNGDKLGNSVSLSDAGTILAIGIPGFTGTLRQGAVRVYEYSSNSWNLLKDVSDNEIKHENPKSEDYFGDCVSVSGNGEVIGIAAPTRGSGDKGLVQMYQRSEGNWVQMASDNSPNGNILGENDNDGDLGLSISLSYDGMTVAIGAQNNSSEKGHVKVYKFENNSWRNQIGSDIDSNINNGKFGASVSLSSDGTMVSVGSAGSSARVFKYGVEHSSDDNLWGQLGQDIDGEASGDRSGYSVSLSSDGTIVAIGAPNNYGNGTNSGHVKVYKYNDTSWNQLGQDIDGEASYDESGYSVSLSSDGTIVAIGVRVNDGNGSASGHVKVYKYNDTSWNQLGQDIDGEASYDYSGYSVSLSSDGTILAIGARNNDGNGTNSGHVKVYKYNDTSWNQLGQDIDGEAEDDYSGCSVSLSSDGTILAIGATDNDGNGSDSGHVKVYKYNDTSWNQLGQDIDGEAYGDESGRSVSLSSDGTIVAIGAPYNDGNGLDSGHVKVYKYNDTSWNQLGQDIDGEASDDNCCYWCSL
jgi:hypothetical protein